MRNDSIRSFVFINFTFLISPFSLFPEPQRARPSCLGLGRVGVSNCAEPAEKRRAQRRRRLGRLYRNPAFHSHGRLRSGVDRFGRASRGLYWNLENLTCSWKFLYVKPQPRRPAEASRCVCFEVSKRAFLRRPEW